MVSTGDLRALQSRHLDDSLALQGYVAQSRTLLDVGSGGGFPGIPLAVTNPSLCVLLVERNRKKCHFLRHVVMKLALENTRVIEGDIRDIRGTLSAFDVITARAVASPARVWSWCRDLLGEDGRMLLQSTSPSLASLPYGIVDSYPSAGIGWINVISRA